MTTLDKHQSSEYVKLLLIGDAKSGKTGSLVSLVKAGYKLCILDLDNLVHSLTYQIKEQCPELLNTVEVRTLRDKRKMTAAGPVIDGQPKAFIDAIKMIDHWKYRSHEGEEIDLGIPGNWGAEYIFILDSLSRFCDAAYNFQELMTPKGKNTGESHGQAVYGNAQKAVEASLATITSDTFETNVIVIAHGVYMDLDTGGSKIFPQGVGQKLSPKIPQYFPSYIRYINKGDKRTIQLKSDSMIDLANPRPGQIPETLPIETGLADFFGYLREPPKQPKPTKLNLRRV